MHRSSYNPMFKVGTHWPEPGRGITMERGAAYDQAQFGVG